MYLTKDDSNIIDVENVVCPWSGTFVQAGGGRMLDDVQEDDPPRYGLEEKVRWMYQMGEAIEALHRVGAVHTDINLGQFLLTNEEGIKMQVRDADAEALGTAKRDASNTKDGRTLTVQDSWTPSPPLPP